MNCGEGHCWVRLQGLEYANRTMIQELQQVEQLSKADWLGGSRSRDADSQGPGGSSARASSLLTYHI